MRPSFYPVLLSALSRQQRVAEYQTGKQQPPQHAPLFFIQRDSVRDHASR